MAGLLVPKALWRLHLALVIVFILGTLAFGIWSLRFAPHLVWMSGLGLFLSASYGVWLVRYRRAGLPPAS